MNKITTLNALKAIKDIEIGEVHIPQWKATVYVRSFDANAFNVFMNLYSPDREFSIQDAATIAAVTMCDERGKRLAEADEVAAELLRHNPMAVQAIYMKAVEMSGLTQKEIDKAEKK